MSEERDSTRRRVLLRMGALAAASSTAGCTVEIDGREFGVDFDDVEATPTYGYGGTPTVTESAPATPTEARTDPSTGTATPDETAAPTETATPDETPTATETATPDETVTATETATPVGTAESVEDYGVQGYGEYGYGGIA